MIRFKKATVSPRKIERQNESGSGQVNEPALKKKRKNDVVAPNNSFKPGDKKES